MIVADSTSPATSCTSKQCCGSPHWSRLLRAHRCCQSHLLGRIRIPAYSASVLLLADELHPSLTPREGLRSSAKLPEIRESLFTHLEEQLSRSNADHALREHFIKEQRPIVDCGREGRTGGTGHRVHYYWSLSRASPLPRRVPGLVRNLSTATL